MSNHDRTARQVGAALRRVRRARRHPRGHLADVAGIPLPQLAAYEQGRELPTVAALAALLSALRCSADEYGRHLGPWGCLP